MPDATNLKRCWSDGDDTLPGRYVHDAHDWRPAGALHWYWCPGYAVVRMVRGPSTPEKYESHVGRDISISPTLNEVPTIGYFRGVPGIKRDGNLWEITDDLAATSKATVTPLDTIDAKLDRVLQLMEGMAVEKQPTTQGQLLTAARDAAHHAAKADWFKLGYTECGDMCAPITQRQLDDLLANKEQLLTTIDKLIAERDNARRAADAFRTSTKLASDSEAGELRSQLCKVLDERAKLRADLAKCEASLQREVQLSANWADRASRHRSAKTQVERDNAELATRLADALNERDRARRAADDAVKNLRQVEHREKCVKIHRDEHWATLNVVRQKLADALAKLAENWIPLNDGSRCMSKCKDKRCILARGHEPARWHETETLRWSPRP